MKGKFIVIEGLEGAGKTTAKQTLIEILQRQGINEIVCTREPGGTKLAEALRQLIKDGIADEVITDKAELLMLYAARSQLVENVIKPALDQGKWVIGDRHDLSTQAYQGGGRGIDKDLLLLLKQAILGDFTPDLTFYLDIDPKIGLLRAKQRGELDRIEQESIIFFQRARARYHAFAAIDPTIVTIDAAQSFDTVQAEISHIFSAWLAQQRIVK